MKTTREFINLSLTVMVLLLMLAIACNKDDTDVPVLSTLSVSEISATSAKSGGDITSDGGADITERGVCWSTIQNPTTDGNKATDGSTGTGGFVTNISGLTNNVTYYVRAYATNMYGTAYGDEKIFTTSATSDYVYTMAATNVLSSSATLNGVVNANNVSTVVSFEYGTTTAYGQTITAAQSPVLGNANTNVSADLSGLLRNTTYHYRVKAESDFGIIYGEDMTFTAQYVIGEYNLGGIIFYVDGTGEHGYICATEDQSTSSKWGCWGTSITTDIAIGTGLSNTATIVSSCSTSGIAAQICNDLVLEGYSDWFLPSKDELNLLYENKDAVNATLDLIGNGTMQYYYWSSSEKDSVSAWVQLFNGGTQSDFKKENYSGIIYPTAYTRAIRAF